MFILGDRNQCQRLIEKFCAPAADIVSTNHLFHFLTEYWKGQLERFFLNFLLIGKHYRGMELCDCLNDYQTIEEQNGKDIVQ